MKKLFAVFCLALILVFSIFSSAASIPKANVIAGKWSLSNDAVYSTVSSSASVGTVSNYLLKYQAYTTDFEFTLETYALRSSQNDSGVFIGTVKNSVYNGVFVKFSSDGLKIIEIQGDKTTEIIPLNAKLGIAFSDDNGQNFFNEMKIKKEGLELSVSVNGNEIITACLLEALPESANIYLSCNVDSTISVSFKNLLFVPVLPVTDSSVADNSSEESSSLLNPDSSLDNSGIGGGFNPPPEEDLFPTELKYVAFISIGVIFLSLIVSVITGFKKHKK